jgi:hypothetical protein
VQNKLKRAYADWDRYDYKCAAVCKHSAKHELMNLDECLMKVAWRFAHSL